MEREYGLSCLVEKSSHGVTVCLFRAYDDNGKGELADEILTVPNNFVKESYVTVRDMSAYGLEPGRVRVRIPVRFSSMTRNLVVPSDSLVPI